MEIEATLTRVFFANKNGWTVGLFEKQAEDGKKTSFKGVGILQPSMLHGKYKLSGDDEASKYGPQFSIRSAILDFSADDPQLLLSYLETTISKKLARAITKQYGDKLISLLRDGEIPELGEEKCKTLYRTWTQHRVYSEVAQELTDLAISSAYHSKILDRWGKSATEVIKENPFILMEITGLGFKKVDTIARNTGILFNDPRRLSASMLSVLQKQEGYGHTWTDVHDLKNKAYELTRVALTETNIPSQALMTEKDQVYNKYLHNAEQVIINRLIEFQGEEQISSYHVDCDELNNQQARAFLNAGQWKVSIITGGPGTGKTFVTKKICELFRDRSLAIVAPTGKAALRATELTGTTAKTIHSFLEPTKGSIMEFTKHEDNPVDASIIIVDEFSMVDTWLFSCLLRAMIKGSRLILIGDVDQLPSIGPGALLRDLIESKKFPVTYLEEIMRTDKPNITGNTLKIKDGLSNFTQGNDFIWIRQQQEDDIRREIFMFVKSSPDYQIIVPMHATSIGTQGLNKELQEIVNPHGLRIKGTQYREGDKIIITQNDYELGVMNGELGIVCGIDETTKKLALRMDSNPEIEKSFPIEITDIMQLGYAITIHKAQGSEFKRVIVPLHTSHKIMLNRNLLYTALTRAKEEVVLLCTSGLLKFALNRRQEVRRTGVLEGLLNQENFRSLEK